MGGYLEYFRQFKYREYLSNKSNILKNHCLRTTLLSCIKEFDPFDKFHKNLMNNKFVYYYPLNYSLPSNILTISLNYKYILNKHSSHINKFYFLELAYARLYKFYINFLNIYIYRMSYKAIYDFTWQFKRYPKGMNYSLDHFYSKLVKCKFDILSFALNYFIKERCRLISKDLISSPLFLIDNTHYIKKMNLNDNVNLIIMDYLGVLYYKFISTLDIKYREILEDDYDGHFLFI